MNTSNVARPGLGFVFFFICVWLVLTQPGTRRPVQVPTRPPTILKKRQRCAVCKGFLQDEEVCHEACINTSNVEVVCVKCGNLIIDKDDLYAWIEEGQERCCHNYDCTWVSLPMCCDQCHNAFAPEEEIIWEEYACGPDDTNSRPVHRACAHEDTLLFLIGPEHGPSFPVCKECGCVHLPHEEHQDEIPF